MSECLRCGGLGRVFKSEPQSLFNKQGMPNLMDCPECDGTGQVGESMADAQRRQEDEDTQLDPEPRTWGDL